MSNVLLPEPEGLMMAQLWPLGMKRETSSRMVCLFQSHALFLVLKVEQTSRTQVCHAIAPLS